MEEPGAHTLHDAPTSPVVSATLGASIQGRLPVVLPFSKNLDFPHFIVQLLAEEGLGGQGGLHIVSVGRNGSRTCVLWSRTCHVCRWKMLGMVMEVSHKRTRAPRGLFAQGG